METEVGIVGFECFSPLGTSFSATWQALVENRSGIGLIDRYKPAEQKLSGAAPVVFGGQIPLGYDEMAGSADRFRRSPEPAHHCVTPVCRQLFEALSFNIADHNPQRIALLGATALTAQISQHTLTTTQRPYVNFILNQCHNIPLALVAREFGLQGPSFTIGGACASGNHALLVAHQMITGGMLDCAVVVGFEFPLLPINAGGFHWLRALYKPDKQDDRAFDRPEAASRPFSIDRRGLLLAEAVGAVLLSDVDYARRIGWPIGAKIRGGYMNSDGDHLTRMAPNNVVVCMRGALEAARCSPDEIDCVNAHATSTPVGDAGELSGLAEVFGARLAELPVVANKSQLGHSLGASSILELMASVEGMKRSVLLPTLNHIPDPELPKAFIPTEATAYPHRVTLLNSFGFGGTNASLVVEACEQRQQ
jgi:3-oxoacyl-[acyl-carrier-protein] synthase II